MVSKDKNINKLIISYQEQTHSHYVKQYHINQTTFNIKLSQTLNLR